MRVRDRLAADRNSLQFKMAATQQRGYSYQLARGKVLGREVGPVNGIEFVEERKIRAGNLHIRQVDLGHASLFHDGLKLVQQDLEFVIHVGRRLTRFVQADTPGEIKRVAGENAVTKRQLRIGIGKVDGTAAGF